MFQRLRTIWKPELFHGPSRHEHFFEGWYYRFVQSNPGKSLIVIPAIYLNRDKNSSYGCVQIMDSETHTVHFQRFDWDRVHIAENEFDLSMAANRFTLKGISLDIDEADLRIRGSITLNALRPWPVSLFSPGAMGWYAFMPFMQCYHGVLSFDHEIEGALVINDREYTFDPGRGYLEKDWGHRFPEGYIWMQSNQFPSPGTSIFVSVARVPWIRGSFNGFLIALLHENRLYRFTTYNASRIESIHADENHIRLTVANQKNRLDIKADRTAGGMLFGPDGTSFRQNILESLNGTVTVTLRHLNTGGPRICFHETARPAAIEINGHIKDILHLS